MKVINVGYSMKIEHFSINNVRRLFANNGIEVGRLKFHETTIVFYLLDFSMAQGYINEIFMRK